MKLRIPSKTFLWGEYSALVGGEAGILTGPPYFQLSPSTNASDKSLDNKSGKSFDGMALFHPASPAGLLLHNKLADHHSKDCNSAGSVGISTAINDSIKMTKSAPSYEFFDPYKLKGGFGRSTAEYISALVLTGVEFLDPDSIAKAWHEYRSLQEVNLGQTKKNLPSGYDFIAQAANTLTHESSFSDFKITAIGLNSDGPEWSVSGDFLKKVGVMIFKTPIKIKTHEHISELNLNHLNDLKNLSQKISECFLNLDTSAFFESLFKFDQELEANNLVHKDTKIICNQVRSFEFVTYVRGCGALGADVVAVFYDSDLDLKHKLSLHKKILTQTELIFIADTNGID